MAKIEELENRQFQLERLGNEGKPLCEEIARNKEHLLYQAESPDSLNGSGRPETGLELDIEGGKNQPQRISRRQFIVGSHHILQIWHEYILGTQLQILEIEKTLESERNNSRLGSRMEYYLNPDGSYTFKAMEKEGIGFKPPKKKIKVTDAEAWAEKRKERERKKNERAGTEAESNRPDA